MSKITDEQRDHLQRLEKDGRLTPSAVLADAKDPKSPLHTLYNWDVKTAAEQHWLDVTRTIIRQIEVRVTTTIVTVDAPHYIKDPSLPAREEGYISTATLKGNHELSKIAVKKELGRALAMLRRAQNVAASLDIISGLADVVARVDAIRETIDGESAEDEAAA